MPKLIQWIVIVAVLIAGGSTFGFQCNKIRQEEKSIEASDKKADSLSNVINAAKQAETDWKNKVIFVRDSSKKIIDTLKFELANARGIVNSSAAKITDYQNQFKKSRIVHDTIRELIFCDSLSAEIDSIRPQLAYERGLNDSLASENEWLNSYQGDAFDKLQEKYDSLYEQHIAVESLLKSSELQYKKIIRRSKITGFFTKAAAAIAVGLLIFKK